MAAFGAHQDVELLALLLGVGALLALAPTLRLPLPILLVIGGVLLGFMPGLPHVQLPPEIVLVAVLPPILYASAFFTSLRDLRKNRRPIALLSFGLVVATMTVVAVVAHHWIGLSWAVAFTLGAIVSPTDALAATEIMGRVGAPHRVVALVEGESLVNDGAALVLYKAAVGAAVGGAFSLADTGLHVILSVVGGIAVGLAVGYVIRQVRKRIDDPPVEVSIAFLSGYLAYLPAAALGVSGVLAAVTVGVYMGWHTPELTTERTRLTGNAFWEIFIFIVNTLLFVLVGLQLRGIVHGISDISSWRLAGYAVVVSLAVILTRLIWVPLAAYIPRKLFRSVREHDPYPPWQWLAIIGWSGMRGAVSLVAGLALPLAFPDRSLILFLTFAVIVATLILQGLTLPWLIRRLHVMDDGRAAIEDAKARAKAAEAALVRIDELEADGSLSSESAQRLRGAYGFRRDRFRARLDDGDDGSIEAQSGRYQRAVRELLNTERSTLLQLRNSGAIDDGVMNRIQRDFDLEAARLDLEE